MGLFETNAPQEPKRSIFDSDWQNSEASLSEERQDRIAPTAVVTLGGGIFSVLAFFSPMFLFIPWGTLGLGILAFVLIARSEKTLTGIRCVWIGLFLAILPLVAIPVSDLMYFHQAVRQARQFSSLLLNAAQKGQTTALYQLRTPAGSRKDASNELAYWQQILGDKEMEKHLPIHTDFLSHPLLLTLAALGEDANISFYRAGPLLEENEYKEVLPIVYTATYTKADGDKESFLFAFGLHRYKDFEKKTSAWCWSSFGKEPLKIL